jgi:hypothetical protein
MFGLVTPPAIVVNIYLIVLLAGTSGIIIYCLGVRAVEHNVQRTGRVGVAVIVVSKIVAMR